MGLGNIGSSIKKSADNVAYQAVTAPRAAPGVGSFTGLGSINPYEDPALAQYMRSLGVNQANLQAEVAVRQNRLGLQAAAQAPIFAEQKSNGIRSIGENAEDRGVFNSGRRVSDQTQYGVGVDRAQLAYNTDISNQSADLSRNLATQISGLNQGAAEQKLAAQQSIALTKAQAGMYQ